ncbi:hypothetical protein KC953_01650 [Candidatus Saccharibacteria bacterium]|nr:hypothetical protein [Candidatus Saccharibacteria bacterium]
MCGINQRIVDKIDAIKLSVLTHAEADETVELLDQLLVMVHVSFSGSNTVDPGMTFCE